MGNRLPIQALDVQLDLLRYYTNDMFGIRYADGVIEVALQDQADFRPGMGRHLHQSILIGDTYAVTDDIVAVLQQAGPSIPNFVFHDSDLPSRSGFVWLESPIIVPDIHQKPLAVHAVGWHVADVTIDDDGTLEPCVMTIAWTAPGDPRDFAHDDFVNEAPHLVMPHGLVSMLTGIWPIGRAWSEVDNADIGLGRFLLAFMRFTQEPWIHNERTTLDRHQRRRAERTLSNMGVVEHVPEVHVIHLRRSASRDSEHGDGNVEWSHRWLVRGHWRNQWYPALGVHKPRWIAEYVKGPDGLPLVVHDKIFSVER